MELQELIRDPVATFALVLLLNVTHRVLQHVLVGSTGPALAALEAEAAELRKEAAHNNTPDTFTAKAKAERKVIALEKRMEALKRQQAANAQHPAFASLRVLKTVWFAAFAIANWGRPVALVEHGYALWPLGGALTSPHRSLRGMGAVAALPWAVLSDRAASAVLRSILPA